MRILFFHRWTGVHLGGTETHVRELAEQFLKLGHQVSLLTRAGQELGDLDPPIRVYRVSKNFGESDHSYENVALLYFHTFLFMVKSFLLLLYLRLLRGQKFDVLSVHFVTEAIVARAFRAVFKTPYVFVLEGYTALEAEEAKRANLAIAISQHEVNETLRHHGYQPLYLPKGRQEYFNLTVDGGPVRQKFLGNYDKLFIAVGRIESRKDYPTLIAAVRLLKERGRRYRFLIAGDGIDFQKIKSLIESLGLTNEVILLGPVKNRDLPVFYRAADLFVLPTLYEGFGYVFVEAMACGLPIVSTKVGAVAEVVDGAGILIEPKDPLKLAQALEELAENEELAGRLRLKAELVAAAYSWQNLAPRYEKAYRSVL